MMIESINDMGKHESIDHSSSGSSDASSDADTGVEGAYANDCVINAEQDSNTNSDEYSVNDSDEADESDDYISIEGTNNEESEIEYSNDDEYFELGSSADDGEDGYDEALYVDGNDNLRSNQETQIDHDELPADGTIQMTQDKLLEEEALSKQVQNKERIRRRNERVAIRRATARATETPEERIIRIQRIKTMRSNETPEHKVKRLLQLKEKYHANLATETPEQRMERRRRKSELAAARRARVRAAETPEQVMERQAKLDRRKLRAAETPVERLVRIQRKRVVENPEQKEQRLLQIKEKYYAKRATETPEEAEERNRIQKEYRKKKRAENETRKEKIILHQKKRKSDFVEIEREKNFSKE